jgi:HTH-type transcriptional regulator/antitoxin HigA
MSEYQTDVPAPGHFIKEELEARGLLQRDLAYILGTTEQVITRLLNGKYGISPEMAKALGKAFDVTPELFINLQRAYDMARAPEPDPGVERRARLQNVYPIREMINRGWLEDTDAPMVEIQMARFFKVANANEINRVAHAAKKTNSGEEATPAQVAWLFRVLQIAEATPAKRYSERDLRDTLQRLLALTIEPEEVRHVPRILDECGVRFIVVEGLPGGKIDGVCCWLDDASPVIGMSVRFDRIDNFWFVLRHEIEHVLRGHGRKQEIIDVNLERAIRGASQEEDQANEAAAEFCVPQAKINSFIVRKSPLLSERDVVAFAKTLGVHPGLVVGQIQRKTERWDFLKRHQVKIRHLVTRAALTDGWGDVAPVSL